METDQKSFVNALVHAKDSAEEFSKRGIQRDVDLDKVRDKLDATVIVKVKDKDGKETNEEMPLRESLRRDMQFRLVNRKGKKKEASFSKDGQEHAADSFDSTAKGHGLTAEDHKRVNDAMATALGLLEEMRAKKKLGPDGKPVLGEDGEPVPFYSNQELMEDVYTPMVREGLLPENLVLDKYSATNELLKNTFERYKDTVKGIEQAKADKRNQTAVNLSGANGLLKRGLAVKDKASEIKGGLEARLTAKLGEANVRRAKLAYGSSKQIYDFVSDNSDTFQELADLGLDKIKGVIPEEALEFLKQAKQNIDGPLQEAAAGPEARINRLKELVIDQQAQQVMSLYDRLKQQAEKIKDGVLRAKWLAAAEGKLENLAGRAAVIEELPGADAMAAFMKNNQEAFSGLCDDLLDELKEAMPEIAQEGIEIEDIKKEGREADHLAAVKRAVEAAADAIDQALAAAVQKVEPAAGVAMAGVYRSTVGIGDAVAAATATPPDGKAVVEKLAAGFPATFAAAAPDDSPVFQKMGAAVAASFRGKADGNALAKALEKEPATAFAAIVAAARAAAGKELTASGGEEAPTDAGNASAFAAEVKDLRKQKEMLTKGAIPDEEETLNELERSDEEMRAYEDQLILLDEGGAAAANAASIDKMIADLKLERKILELVASMGTALLGAGSAGASAGFKIAGMAATAPGPTIVTGMFSAAKMIVKLAVNTKKAADRWVLWFKFRDSLKKAKTASSALTSSIQGFFNNKKEQIAFHTIEDALLAVQIAGSIAGAVPEPITAAVGQSVTLAAQAASIANDIAGKVYDEAMLSSAWANTVAAMNSPANRALGLKALRLNPTLAMHAIAWAGAQRQPPDPIARMLLRQLGIDEKNLAASGDEGKVRDYLTLLLDEDRSILTSGELTINWMPKNYSFGAADFFKIITRASRDATPKLAQGGEPAVMAALKPLVKHDLIALKHRTKDGKIEPAEIYRLVDEAVAAKKALRSYRPVTSDGSMQEDMMNVQAEFLKMAASHLETLEAYAEDNLLARAKRQEAVDAMAAELDAIEALPDDADEQTKLQAAEKGSKLLKELSKTPWLVSHSVVSAAMKQLAAALLDLKAKKPA